MAKTMPIAVTGPSTLFDFRSLRRRPEEARDDGAAEASTGSRVACQACRVAAIASSFCTKLRDSEKRRAVSSRWPRR